MQKVEKIQFYTTYWSLKITELECDLKLITEVKMMELVASHFFIQTHARSESSVPKGGVATLIIKNFCHDKI